MNERRPESPQAASLRERAEKVFREMLDSSLENLDALSPETLRAALHELRVHQIELEMQNEDMRRAQADLDASRERYFDLYDLAPVGYCTVGEKGVILEANLTAATLLGAERGALVGRLLTAFISKEGQDLYYRCRKNLLDTRQPQECDLRMLRPDGTAFFARLKITFARDENEAPVCRVALIDITAHKQAEDALRESEAQVRVITDSAQDAIIMMDHAGLISYWNPAAGSIFGYRREEALGRNLHDLLVPEPYHSAYRAAYPEFQRTGQGNAVGKTIEMAARRKDGKEIAVALSMSAVMLNGEWHSVGIVRDVTERKRAEEELREALLSAKAAALAKSEFLAMMSHEQRTPLNGVIGFAEILADSPLTGEQREFARTIGNSGNHLLAIVNDILDLASIEKNALAIEEKPLSVAELVKAADLTVRAFASEKGLKFRCVTEPGVPEEITGDERRIRQILINLLNNAVKFTSSGSLVLRVAAASDGGRRFLDFSVEDTGIGISPETLELLFKPFVQADAKMSRAFEGAGLGLAISKQLAESMGGTITVASTPRKGSTFTFRLPLESPARRTAAPPLVPGIAAENCAAHKRDAHEPLLVLVVEDDPDCIKLCRVMLESLGCRAEFAADGAEAVRAFAPGKFSCILMDLAMPVMDGLEATREIRGLEAGSGVRVPIIALTANAMPSDRELCLAAGMDDFLSKPFTKAQLAAKISRP